MRRLLLAAFFVVASAGTALATPTDDLVKAMSNLATASSYHIAAQNPQGQKFDADVVPPDKIHMISGQMEMIHLPGATYVKMNGNWMQLPSSVPQMQMPAVGYAQTLGKNAQNATVEDLGQKPADGAVYHAYKVTPANGKPATVYVDGAGMPARVDVTDANGVSVVRFSNFNAGVKIAAPL